jgi:hypothetical protein
MDSRRRSLPDSVSVVGQENSKEGQSGSSLTSVRSADQADVFGSYSEREMKGMRGRRDELIFDAPADDRKTVKIGRKPRS